MLQAFGTSQKLNPVIICFNFQDFFRETLTELTSVFLVARNQIKLVLGDSYILSSTGHF